MKNLIFRVALSDLAAEDATKVISILEKKVPKMVVYTDYAHDYVPPKCPNCYNSILDYGQKYCEDCGQKLEYKEQLKGQGELEL